MARLFHFMANWNQMTESVIARCSPEHADWIQQDWNRIVIKDNQ